MVRSAKDPFSPLHFSRPTSSVNLVPKTILVLIFIPFSLINFSFYLVLALKIILVLVFILFLTFNFSFSLVLILK